MKLSVPYFSLRLFYQNSFWAVAYLVVMCIQLVAIEGYGVSPIKIALMGVAPLVFIFKTPYFSKALIWGILYWVVCFFSALYNGNMRFSTIGYLGMFAITAITFFHLIQLGVFSLNHFIRLLKYLIIAYGVILILQQICMLVGIHYFPLINLCNQHFLSLTKLPSLSWEPSSTARILTGGMLSYIHCIDLLNDNKRLTIKDLFKDENKWVTGLFLWTMLTMGSGTAFIGLGILSLYFVTRKTAVYVIPVLIALLFIGSSLEIKQLDRAVRVAQVSMTGDINAIIAEDGSASARIVPLVNTLTIDLTKKESWIGHGTSSSVKVITGTQLKTGKIAVVEQYGLIAFFISLIWVYSCMIRRFFSVETLVFALLLGMSLANIAYTWGCLMMFTAVRHFQVQQECGTLVLEENKD